MRKCSQRNAQLFALALATARATVGFSATTYTWITPLFGTGTGNDDWSTPGNWSPTGVPAGGDTALVPGDGLFGGSVLYDYAGPAVTLSLVNISASSSGGRTTPTSYLYISANNLSANEEYVGDSGSSIDGRGEIDQSGGTNSISGLTNSTLYLAYNQTDIGTYNLSGSATLAATNLVVGYNGTATFTQTGGTGNFGQLVVNQSYGSGTYNLSGNGVVNATDETIGENGSGTGGATFLQLGGINSAGSIGVGIQGTGTYTQIGGAIVATNGLSVGDNQGAGSGTFNFEAGTLNSGAVNVGAVGLGTFNHSGGTFIATSLTLGAAGYEEEVSGDGQYYLSGSGTLIVTGFEAIAGDGSGEFTQTGGTNTDDGNLVIPEPSYTGSANYSLSGGSASANGTQIGTDINSSTARGTLAVTGNGTFTDPLGINLQTRGTLSLGGGTINTASVQMSGGTFAWTSGTLNITGAAGLTIDTGDLLGAVASITPGEILHVTTTLTNNGSFTNTSQVSAGNVVNVGTFTSEATLTVAGSFTNSGTAILGGTQNWRTARHFQYRGRGGISNRCGIRLIFHARRESQRRQRNARKPAALGRIDHHRRNSRYLQRAPLPLLWFQRPDLDDLQLSEIGLCGRDLGGEHRHHQLHRRGFGWPLWGRLRRRQGRRRRRALLRPDRIEIYVARRRQPRRHRQRLRFLHPRRQLRAGRNELGPGKFSLRLIRERQRLQRAGGQLRPGRQRRGCRRLPVRHRGS